MENIWSLFEKMKPLLIKAFDLELNEFSDPLRAISGAIDAVRNTEYLDGGKAPELIGHLQDLRSVRNRYAHPKKITYDHDMHAILTMKLLIDALLSNELLGEEECSDARRSLEERERNLSQSRNRNPPSRHEISELQNAAISSMAASMDALLGVATILSCVGNAMEGRQRFEYVQGPEQCADDSPLADLRAIVAADDPSALRDLAEAYDQLSGQTTELEKYAKKIGLLYNIVMSSKAAEGLFSSMDVFIGMKKSRLKRDLLGIRKEMIEELGIPEDDCVLNDAAMERIVSVGEFDTSKIKEFFEQGVIVDLPRQSVYFGRIEKAIEEYEAGLFGVDRAELLRSIENLGQTQRNLFDGYCR